MGKFGYDWSKSKYDRFMAEGRGKGTGPNYLPWITLFDFSSRGFVSAPISWKTGRQQQVFSLHEYYFQLMLDWCGSVIDICEQYPLDIDDTMRIADKAGIRYFRSKIDNFPYVITTDFRITVELNGRLVNLGRTIKEKKELQKKSVMDWFEIERRYYMEKNENWGIVFAEDIPLVAAENINWLHTDYNLSVKGYTEDELKTMADMLMRNLRSANPENRINDVLVDFEHRNQFENNTVTALFKNLLARRRIIFDINKKINLVGPLKNLDFSASEEILRRGCNSHGNFYK